MLKFTAQNKREIDVLRIRVHNEHVRLLMLLEILFESVGIEIEDVVKGNSATTTGSTLDALLEERLSGAYPIFVELMGSIAICVNELVRRLEKVRLHVA